MICQMCFQGKMTKQNSTDTGQRMRCNNCGYEQTISNRKPRHNYARKVRA